MTLSFSRALDFVESSLGVKDMEKKFSEDKHKLLEEIIRAYFRELPFQTISLLAPPTNKRRVPTEEDIVTNGLSLKGGVCLDLNYFMTVLLQALGYDAHASLGRPGRDGMIHVVVVVKNLKSCGDRFLVDVGIGYPTFPAIPLDNLPYMFVNCGLEVKYINKGDRYYRLHRKGDIDSLEKESEIMHDDWRQFFDFDLEPRKYSELADPLTSLYCGDFPDKMSFHRKLHAVRYPGDAESTVFALGNVIATQNGNGETVEEPEVFESYTDMEEAIILNFPHLDRLEVRAALTRLQKTKELIEQSQNKSETENA